MTTEIDNGGPAFPLQSIGPKFEYGYSGMTLRDYFAAKAMQGFAACEDCAWKNGVDGLALGAYELADAMIAARNTK